VKINKKRTVRVSTEFNSLPVRVKTSLMRQKEMGRAKIVKNKDNSSS
jgi:hypothetical protein